MSRPEGSPPQETRSSEVPEVSLLGLKEVLDVMHAKNAEGFRLIRDYQIKDEPTKERINRLIEDARLITRVLNKVLPLGGLDTWAIRTVVDEESLSKEIAIEEIAAGPH